MNKKIKTSSGFTLIELMVVIAIIGILAAVVITTVNAARSRGRDAKRMRDIQEINTAIALYVLTNGQPPSLGSSSCANISNYDPSCFASSSTGLANWNILATELEPFLKILPSDPCPTCVASGTLILNAYAANSVSEYVYQAPAAVNAYLVDSGLDPSQAGIAEQSYSVYTTYLEGQQKPFGFGLSVQSSVLQEEDTQCPYDNDSQCKLWESCNNGDEKACAELNPKQCPYKDDQEKCTIWESCNNGDEKACAELGIEQCPYKDDQEKCTIWEACNGGDENACKELNN